MKEKPIIFGEESIKAILTGKKTQTRRIIKYAIPDGFDPLPYPNGKWTFQKPGEGHLEICSTEAISCPYGKPGESLWVRENFWLELDSDYSEWLGKMLYSSVPPSEAKGLSVYYCATDDDPNTIEGLTWAGSRWEKKPSIFMPRWASRISLVLTGVRVERVQYISPADMEAEGMRWLAEHSGNPYGSLYDTWKYTWDKINAKRGFSWESNPWVWVLEWEKVEIR